MRSGGRQESTFQNNPFNQQQYVPKKQQANSDSRQLEESKEESKVMQPAGTLVDSKTKANPQKLLILADDKASFFNIVSDKNSQSLLEEDSTLPNFPLAKVARYAPLGGQQAAIVDELGIHFVDMSIGRETVQIANPGIESLMYSPADSYVVTCEKFNPN